MTTRVIGKNVHKARLKRLKGSTLRDPVIRELYRVGEIVRKDAQESIRANGVPSPNHIVSKPGKPPNADTNNLDLSIDVRPNKAKTRVEVTARAEYAAALEFGTARIKPRPFMRPALQRNRNQAVQGAVQAVNTQIRVFKDSKRSINAARRFIRSGGTNGR